MKILAYSVGEYEVPLLQKASASRHQLTLLTESLTPETAPRAQGYDAVLVFTTDDASAPVLQRLHEAGVRYLVTRSAGTDHIDLPAAERLGLRVASVPRYSPHAIAEHAVGMMLALGRHLIRSTDNARRFDFALTKEMVGFELHGKTAGIAGFGKIGAVAARILSGFGCRVLAYDLFPEQAAQHAESPVEFVELPVLLTESDVLSVHLPLTDATRGLFNAETFGQMKRGAMLINTGRGGVLDTRHALKALQSGQLGYLGIDVYEHERGLFFGDHSDEKQHDPLLASLLALDNVLVTGHQGFLTHEALEAIAQQAIGHLDRWKQETAASLPRPS